MKKVILLLIGFVLFSNVINAQSVKRDVVYLKNGSIIKGEIVEQVPNKTITIQTMDGSTFVYSFNDIKKITKEAVSKQSTTTVSKSRGKKFSYYSLNLGGGTGFKMNLVELNFAGNNGFGGMLKWGGGVSTSSNSYNNASASGVGYLVGGPSYSFGAGNTIGAVSFMIGYGTVTSVAVAYDEYGNQYSEGSADMGFVYGLGYTHRFFTNHRWNLTLGLDYIAEFASLNLGFAYSW